MLIDINVWSEFTRPDPNPDVVAWMRKHAGRAVLSTLVEAELWMGVANLGEGPRAAVLRREIGIVREAVGDRILDFDSAAAQVWGFLLVRLQRAGAALTGIDLLIAAQALAHDMPVVTRNLKHFERTGVTLINPWEA